MLPERFGLMGVELMRHQRTAHRRAPQLLAVVKFDDLQPPRTPLGHRNGRRTIGNFRMW